MLSTRELWSVISGRSSLSNPKSVGEELERYKVLLKNGIDYYKLPNSTSLQKVKSSDSVKRKDFILKLSKILNLDEWITHELFTNYLRMDFRGSGPQLQAILKHDVQLEGFMLKVLDFYFKERLHLLKCIKYLLSYWQDETCLFREEFAKVIDEFANENIISKVITQLKQLFKIKSNHDGIKGNQVAQKQLAIQLVMEQCEMADIVFLYYKDFELSPQVFLDLAKFFRCQHFGFSQVNRKLISQQGQHFMERFGYISSLILLEALDMDMLRKSFHEQDSSDVNEHPFMENHLWTKVDELLYTWDDVPQQGPVLMAWTIFRHICLAPDQQQLTKLFSDAAIRCDLINYLNNMLSYPLLEKINDSMAGLVKTFVYILLSLMITLFDEDSIGSYETVTQISCKLLSEPPLSVVCLTQDQNSGLDLLLRSARNRFPFMTCPYLNLMKSMCTSPDTVDLVFNQVEKQTCLTELFGKNSVTEIEASCSTENVWNRKVGRIVLNYHADAITLPAGVYGKVHQHRASRLIRWTYSYSGWLYLMLQLNSIADSPMTYTSDSDESGMDVAKNTVELVTSIITHDTSKIEELEPIIATVVKLLRRISQLSSVPLELVASCLKCLQTIVLHLPFQIWNQLSSAKFLPFHKNVLANSNEPALQLVAGTYGQILHKAEMPTSCYHVTKEYLSFMLQFLNGLSSIPCSKEKSLQMQLIHDDVSVNIVFIIKEILSSFGRWRYTVNEDKEKIGLRCMEICHAILSTNLDDILSVSEKSSSLSSLVQEGLLYNTAGESLLDIVSVGVDTIEGLASGSMSQTSDIIQLVKLSFAVVNILFTKNKKVADVCPLEDAFREQCVTQLSELDFIQKTTKVTLLSVIARYIYHRHDPKLPILAIIVLRSLAVKFPMILTSCFGDSLVGLRNAFVNRLNGRIEAVRLKVAIIEFLTTCIETQPGIVESFCHIVQNSKDKSMSFGRFSCVTAIWQNIDCKLQFDVLSSVSLEFIAALWINRYDIAMSLIKKSDKFWERITIPIQDAQSCTISKSTLEVMTHVLNIVAYESYFVKSEHFDEGLSKQLKNLSDGKSYSKIGTFLKPLSTDCAQCLPHQLKLLKAWKIYLTVMMRTQSCSCGLDTKIVVNTILKDVIDAATQWINVDDKIQKKEMLECLSDLCSLITFKCKKLLSDSEKLLHSINVILHELLVTDRELFEVVQQPLCFTALRILQEEYVEHESTSTELLAITSTVCKWLQFLGNVQNEKTNTNPAVGASITLLTELVHYMPSSQLDSFVTTLKEHGIIYTLLNVLDSSLQTNKNMDRAENILLFFLACSQHHQIAEHLCGSGIGKLLCLSVKNIYTDTTEQIGPSRSERFKIWSLVIGIAARLLKILQHAFLESAIDFLGTHKEALLQTMNVIEQLVIGDNLFTLEQVSALCYELALYQNDVTFALPNVFQSFKMAIGHMVRLSVALLARQKILGHLVECKAGDNIERLISRTKTPSPTSFRSDSTKSLITNDAIDQLSHDAECAQTRLINVLSYSIGAMRRLTPNVIESILDEGMDIDCFLPLIDINFKSPSLELDSTPSFGTLVSCLNICLKMIQKMSQSDSDRTTPDKDFTSVNIPDVDKKRSSLWFIIDNTLIVLLSQASCYLRHPSIDDRANQFLKRELGTELSDFLCAVHRFRTRRGMPPSPISSEKLGSQSMLSLLKRSPSKLSTSFTEGEEDTLLKLVDMYSKNLLR